jgi:hypothetical protein
MYVCVCVDIPNHEDCVCNPHASFEMNGYAGEGVKYSRNLMPEALRDGIDKVPLVKELPELGVVLCNIDAHKQSLSML